MHSQPRVRGSGDIRLVAVGHHCVWHIRVLEWVRRGQCYCCRECRGACSSARCHVTSSTRSSASSPPSAYIVDLNPRDLSCARQSRTVPRTRTILGLESYAITRHPSFNLRFLGILLFKSLLRYSRHDTMISRVSSLSIIQMYSLGTSM